MENNKHNNTAKMNGRIMIAIGFKNEETHLPPSCKRVQLKVSDDFHDKILELPKEGDIYGLPFCNLTFDPKKSILTFLINSKEFDIQTIKMNIVTWIDGDNPYTKIMVVHNTMKFKPVPCDMMYAMHYPDNSDSDSDDDDVVITKVVKH